VPHERRHVDALGAPVDGVQVLGERLEAPVDALLEGVHRHALHVLERAHDGVAVLGPGGRDAEPAIAHHDARDPVPRRRREVAVPEDLRVVVRVDVDEARRQRQAVEVDHLRCRVGHQLARERHGGDAVAGDRDVGRPGGGAGPVDQRATAQQQVHRPSDRSARPARPGTITNDHSLIDPCYGRIPERTAEDAWTTG
jgi:hypothetical protein